MGTNYYLQEPPCPHCGRSGDRVHIGKSSVGWVFSLHVEPDDPNFPHNLKDWVKLFAEEGRVIVDEYGRETSTDDMLITITKRFRDRGWDEGEWWFGYTSERAFHISNDSERGPNNLLQVNGSAGRHFVGHGGDEGTFDMIRGEFS